MPPALAGLRGRPARPCGAWAVIIACCGFGGCFGSWTMTVAFANANEPARNLNVWHGWQNTPVGGEQTNTVTGTILSPSGPVTARIGVAPVSLAGSGTAIADALAFPCYGAKALWRFHPSPRVFE